ncbi:uncharacterized protein [Dysidea avara]|uniref:uncharacterized protein isoform X1 n=1 Tax=Dysidea avara TaxID=196820 RepID=UPI003331FBE6
MLRVMENCDNPLVKFLAGEIKKSMISAERVGHSSDHTKERSTELVKFSENVNIDSAFNKTTSAIEGFLATKKFSSLRRACIERINTLGSYLPKKLIPKIKCTNALDQLLELLADSEYWNWFDTILLEALTYATGLPEAIEWLEDFKKAYYSRKISEFIPWRYIKPSNEYIQLDEKLDKRPSELTIWDLRKHKFKLEYEILGIEEGDLVLNYIRTGCVELTWQLPDELIYRAYTSMKRNVDKLPSLAVKSLVCKVADEFAGLPILWRGQEVGEVGPIEPLSEHVRQEPYSLPQGCRWVSLSSSNDADEIVDFMNVNNPSAFVNSTMVYYYTKHPSTRSDWQFGIRVNGKLMGTVMAYPFCLNIRGVQVTFIMSKINCHVKYHNQRLRFMLYKELMRRASLSKVNQMLISLQDRLFRPVVMVTNWDNYRFEAPKHLQSSSSRIPGWKKMTARHIPGALALVNKYSSQFEIGQVFSSEEEISHHFLCPAVPDLVSTYVVESKAIVTDLISFKLFHYYSLPIPSHAHITTVVSTKTSIKSLLTNGIAHAKESGASTFSVSQCNIESEILESLSFKQSVPKQRCFYNYRYHEISQANFWCTLD